MSGKDEESAEKSFEPTQKKLDDARKRGEVPKSTDLNTAAAYLGLILALVLAGPLSLQMFGGAARQMIASPDIIAPQVFNGGGQLLFTAVAPVLVVALAGVFGLPALGVIGSLFAQRAFAFSTDKIQPKLNKISMISGAKNKFGANGLFEFAKSTVKLCLVSGILGWFFMSKFEEMMVALFMSPGQVTLIMADLTLEFLLIIFIMMLMIGGIDYLWQSGEHIRKNRMTRKEMTDENKETEGDPHLKQARRQRAQDIATNQMLTDVPDADVVVVNPTHYAVALKWDRTSGRAPVCVAKGMDEIAARIREIANENDVPIHSDPPTARALHATIDIGDEIDREHYKAVAAAIRFAEAMRAKSRQRR